MQKGISFLIAFMMYTGLTGLQNPPSNEYTLIKEVPEHIEGYEKAFMFPKVNIVDINKLDEPLRALAAYYSAFAGSDCDEDTCSLTSALGLGLQGSAKHKELIQKWFANDTLAQKMIARNCSLPRSSSSVFNNYTSLVFDVKADTVIVSYSFIVYSHGKGLEKGGRDEAIIQKNSINILTRRSWKKK